LYRAGTVDLTLIINGQQSNAPTIIVQLGLDLFSMIGRPRLKSCQPASLIGKTRTLAIYLRRGQRLSVKNCSLATTSESSG
jgi:hypothetical protein